MSARLVAATFKQSKSKGIDRLILLAIADELKDDGESHALDFSSISAKTQVLEPVINHSVRKLVSCGELGFQPGIPKLYRILFDNPVVPSRRYISKSQCEPRSDVGQLCNTLVSLLKGVGYTNPKIQPGWHNSARLLLDADGHSLQEALEIMEWALHDDFWKTNIRSIPKFRIQYDQLRVKMKAQQEISRKKQMGSSDWSEQVRSQLRRERSGVTPSVQGAMC